MLAHQDLMSDGDDFANPTHGGICPSPYTGISVATVPDLCQRVSRLAVVGALHIGMVAEPELSIKRFIHQFAA